MWFFYLLLLCSALQSNFCFTSLSRFFTHFHGMFVNCSQSLIFRRYYVAPTHLMLLAHRSNLHIAFDLTVEHCVCINLIWYLIHPFFFDCIAGASYLLFFNRQAFFRGYGLMLHILIFLLLSFKNFCRWKNPVHCW